MTHEPAPPAAARPFLETLKRKGPATIRELSQRLRITYEAARQQINALLDGGWIAAAPDHGPPAGRGRRPQHYVLSEAGEHVFPKHYDALSSELVSTLAESCGSKALTAVLERMTQARVDRWRPQLARLPLKPRLQALRGLYEEDDAYMEIKWRGKVPLLIERNCPFLSVAKKHPALCSVSVCTLSRLLGVRVVRERRFQDGDGCCVFRVCVDEPLAEETPFAIEEPKSA
jgi:predicted ArsR family transcriptional regulator